jgi:hypothetical protein
MPDSRIEHADLEPPSDVIKCDMTNEGGDSSDKEIIQRKYIPQSF